MKHTYKLSNSVLIEVESSPLASGGEADVFEIVSPITFSSQVLKVYKVDKRSKNKEDKLKFLTQNKPNFNIINGHNSVVWPTHLAFFNGEFVGYTMPKATGIKLEFLCHPKLHKSISKEYDKFSLSSPGALAARLKLCFNLAVALSEIHSFGSYVLVDMKPDNVMVKPDGLISIIDIDSTEIVEKGKLLFPAQVITPEYAPPEYYKQKIKIEAATIDETWDRFSLAVIFYRLICGIHPFTGTLKTPFETLTNTSDIIEKGFLPVGKSKDKFQVIPPTHKGFDKVDTQVQHFLLIALEGGYFNTRLRPSADDWCRVLSPDLGIQINRSLPSKINGTTEVSYSRPSLLKKIPDFNIGDLSFINKSKKKSLLERFLGLFRESERDKLWRNVLGSQFRVTNETAKLKDLRKIVALDFSTFNEKQVNIINAERNELDKLLKILKETYYSIDYQAKDLFIKELDKCRTYQHQTVREISFIEFKIKEQFELTVKRSEESFEKQRTVLNNELTEVINKESIALKQLEEEMRAKLEKVKADIQVIENQLSSKVDNAYKSKKMAIEEARKELREKEKKLLSEALEQYQSSFTNSSLSQYKISDDRLSIFSDTYANPTTIVFELSRYAIITAADIKGIDASGRILRSDGMWIKVPGVAISRAKKLDEWRQKKERTSPTTPPQVLPYSQELQAKKPLVLEFAKIDQEERRLIEEINKEKSKVLSTLSSQLIEFKKKEESIIKDIQINKTTVSNYYINIKNSIQQKILDLRTNMFSLKLNEQTKFEINTKQYKLKLDLLKQNRDEIFSKIKAEFDVIHEQLVKKVREAKEKFLSEAVKIKKNTSNELSINESNYEMCFNSNTEEIKKVVNSYTSAVSELLKVQNMYNKN